MDWATFWAIVSPTHPVTLLMALFSKRTLGPLESHFSVESPCLVQLFF
jgi:hypothetical protein